MQAEIRALEGECRQDAECPGLAICENSFCVEPECIRDEQCDVDGRFRCQGGRCVERPNFCLVDAECDGEQICENEQCVSTNGACSDVDDCPDQASCYGGSCILARSCRVNRDCRGFGTPARCRNGVCRATADECNTNADCFVGNSCYFGICGPSASPECVRDRHCDAGRICEAQRCVVP